MRRTVLALVALAAGLVVVAHRRVLGIARRPTWPPGSDAVTSDGAQAATEAFGAREGAGPRDAALGFAWSTAATLEPLVDGHSFFPRIFADVEAARSSVHILMFVIDGDIAWTGGAGIEDHFNDGRFHDLMVRVTGDVVRQAQAAFLTSFRAHGGPLPADLSRYFSAQAEPGSTPIALAQVIPGGFLAASQAILEQIDDTREHLDMMNPYLTDPDVIALLISVARRGVRVRVVVSQKSNNGAATAALRHRYAELDAAGAELWEVPDTVVHAKVVVADDVISFGTVNLDAWALYRNSEILMIARSPEAAALLRRQLVEADIARSTPGEPPTATRQRLEGWLCDKLTYYL